MPGQEKNKFITVPKKGGSLFSPIPKNEIDSFKQNSMKALKYIANLEMDAGKVSSDTINKLTDIIINYAPQGYCKIDFDVFFRRYENGEVKFSDMEYLINNSYESVKEFQKDYKSRTFGD